MPPKLKIAITGASGRVGRRLVLVLAERGHELILFGRDAAKLQQLFPGYRCHSNDHLASAASDCDALVHLAVLNNDVRGSSDEFEAVNVGYLEQVVAAATQARVKCLVNLSSTHVLEEKTGPYATSKRAAAELVRNAEAIAGVNVYCAKIYKADPQSLTAHPLLWKALGALKPTVEVGRLADCLERAISNSQSREIICTDGQRSNPVYAAGQFLIDIGVSAAVIILLGWAMILVAIAVRLNSPGPAIFAQTRVGGHGEPFTCYKFRTMRMGTPQAGTHEVSSAAVTSIGRWLRRTKLDELPQVWNILRRELSFVGPRPCLPSQTELIAERKARGVDTVKPGITGLAQVNEIDMSSPATLAEWDARYVALQSLWTDLQIILFTVTGRGSGDRTRADSDQRA